MIVVVQFQRQGCFGPILCGLRGIRVGHTDKASMGNLKWWIPLPNGERQLMSIPEDYVKNVILKSIEHEPGHIVVAHHLGGMIIGIAVGFMPERRGMFLYSSYGWGGTNRPDYHRPTIEEECIVKTAGPAADLMFHGSFSKQNASGDLHDIGVLTNNPNPSFAPYMDKAQQLLQRHDEEVRTISHLLETRIKEQAGILPGVATNSYHTLVRLPDGRMGDWILSDANLMPLLKPWQNPSRPVCVCTERGNHSETLVTMLDHERHHEIEVCTNCLPSAEQEEWFQWYSLTK